MVELFNTLIYNPIYNLLIFLMGTFSWIDLGLAVVFVTILVKLAMFPLSRRAVKTQEAMKVAKPELDKITAEFKKINKPTPEQRQEMGKKTLEVYKEYGIKPFSSFFVILIQLPIFLALYWIFYSGGLPDIRMDLLYSYVPTPDEVRMTFLNLFDISGRSIILALIAGVTQYIYLNMSMGKIDMSDGNSKYGALGQDFAKTLQVQMKYGLPVLIAVIAYISAVIALYFVATNIFMLIQDSIIKRKTPQAT